MVGITVRTFERWTRGGLVHEDQRPTAPRPEPSHKLTEQEREQILATVNSDRFASLSPTQIVPILLDEGEYIGSESSFYRVMRQAGQQQHRGRAQKPKQKAKPQAQVAYGPNEVWSWDITYLPTPVTGRFYYLYLFMDIYGRNIVAHEVHDRECGELASDLVSKGHLKAGQPAVVLHSDNGAPMTAYTFRAKLTELGITPSYSRPRVSDDNPYSESLFRTVKYCPAWPPAGFESLEQAREWVECFVQWYNTEHRHSQLNFVTPEQRCRGEDAEILRHRRQRLEQARAEHPQRWSKGVRNCDPAGPVSLNPGKPAAALKLVSVT